MGHQTVWYSHPRKNRKGIIGSASAVVETYPSWFDQVDEYRYNSTAYIVLSFSLDENTKNFSVPCRQVMTQVPVSHMINDTGLDLMVKDRWNTETHSLVYSLY